MTGARWRCGIIGYGRIGKLYRDLIERSGGGLAVTDVADTRLPRDVEPCAAHSSHKELLQQNLDAVIVATPAPTHFEIARAALMARKHVLLEKPPAATVEEVESLREIANEQARVLFFAFHARYNESVARCRTELRNSRVSRIDVAYRENVERYHDPGSWVLTQGVLRDSGINAVSVLTEVLPHLSCQVTHSEFHFAGQHTGPVRTNIRFCFDQEGLGSFELDWRHQGPEVRVLTFRTGDETWTLDIVTDSLLRNGVPVAAPANAGGMETEYTRMIADFVRHLNAGSSLCSTEEVSFVEQAERTAVLRAESMPAHHSH
jgi:D-galactose 1-dehydrogenase